MLQPATQIRSGRSGRVPTHQIGNDLLRQQLEGLRVAEKAGDVDQQILGKELELSRVLPQHIEISATVLDSGHRHPPLDPPL